MPHVFFTDCINWEIWSIELNLKPENRSSKEYKYKAPGSQKTRTKLAYRQAGLSAGADNIQISILNPKPEERNPKRKHQDPNHKNQTCRQACQNPKNKFRNSKDKNQKCGER